MAAAWALIDTISTRSVQSPTEAAPVSADDGLPLNAVIAITVWLDAGVGQTLTSDAGQADLYLYDNSVWGISPSVVLSVPPGSAGQRRVSLGTVAVENQRGRLAPILNGVTISGATATLDILATVDRRGISKPS